MASKLKETGGAAPQHDERITEVIAELRKLNAASKGNALGEKEATGRAVGEEKRAKAKDKKDEKGGWLGSRVGMKEQFTRRFVAARAVNLSLPGNRTNLENQLKLLEFAKNQFDYHEWDKAQTIAIQGDQAELDREKDKVVDTTKDDKKKKLDKTEKDTAKQTKGFFSKLLGKFTGGGFMMGAGALLGGLGVLAGGAGLLLKELNDLDGKAIRANVNELFGISDDVGGKGAFFLEGGTFMLAMTGLGIGLALFSVGSTIAGLSDGLTNFTNPTWAQSIVDNVTTLLSISDLVGGKAELLKEGGAFALSMTGIGIGIGMFGVGGAVAAIGATFDETLKTFTGGTGWADNLKTNVKTLLGIKDELGGNWDLLKDGMAFGLAMAGIGIGVGLFGIGGGLAAVGASFDETLKTFTGGVSWADNLKANVITLLSIKDELGGNWDLLKDAGAFVLAMTGIALGIGVFAIGGAAGVATAGFDAALKSFSGESFATNIKKNVVELLSIKDELGGNWDLLKDSGAFVLAMTGIGLGLAAFAVGKAGSGLAEIITQFSGVGFASTIKANVVDLLGISSLEGVNMVAATEFAAVMGVISAGVLAFSVTKGFDALVGVGAGILNFFSGNESPVGEMLKIADKADELDQAATALDSLADALHKMTMLKFSNLDLEFSKFANDLAWGVKGIHVAMYGGTFDPPGFLKAANRAVTIDAGKGLASIAPLDFENAGTGITILNRALNNWDGSNTKGEGAKIEGGATTGDITTVDDHSTKVIINQAPEIVTFEGKQGFAPLGN